MDSGRVAACCRRVVTCCKPVVAFLAVLYRALACFKCCGVPCCVVQCCTVLQACCVVLLLCFAVFMFFPVCLGVLCCVTYCCVACFPPVAGASGVNCDGWWGFKGKFHLLELWVGSPLRGVGALDDCPRLVEMGSVSREPKRKKLISFYDCICPPAEKA